MTLASVQPVIPAPPAGDGGPKGAPPAAPQRVEGTEFDVDAAMEAALKVAGGGALPADEPSQVQAKPKPEPETQKPKEGDEEDLPPPPADLTQKKLSDGFAKLERQKRRDQKEFSARTAALTERESALTAREQVIQAREAEFKSNQENPLVLLQQHGWDMDRLVRFVMDDGKVPPEVLAQRATEAQKREIDGLKQEQENLRRQRQQHEDALLSQEWERRTFAGVDEVLGTEAAPKQHQHPTIAWVLENMDRSVVLSDVLTVQAAHFKQTGQTLDPKAALVHVERAYAQRFNRRSRNPEQAGAGAPAQPGAAKPRQFTSQDLSDVSTPSQEEIDNMSDDERMELAIRVARGSRS